jgi:MAD (mothers against decapentaplegic) family protein 1
MLAKITRWVPVPVEIPSTITLHRQKRDFGITAAVVMTMAASAAAATAARIAMATSVQSSTTVQQLSSSVAEAIDQHSVLSAQLQSGLMIVNQRIDLVEERREILLQLAQLGCDKKSGALCITSVQYENWTHAANLSKKLSLFLTGNCEGFDEKLEALRTAVMTINSTRVDPSLIDGIKGLSS